MDEFADHVLDAIIDIGSENAGQQILAITHGWTLDVITRHIAGLPRSAMLLSHGSSATTDGHPLRLISPPKASMTRRIFSSRKAGFPAAR